MRFLLLLALALPASALNTARAPGAKARPNGARYGSLPLASAPIVRSVIPSFFAPTVSVKLEPVVIRSQVPTDNPAKAVDPARVVLQAVAAAKEPAAAAAKAFDGKEAKKGEGGGADAVEPPSDGGKGGGGGGDSGGKDSAGGGKPSRDYARMFDITLRALTRPEIRKFLSAEFKDELLITEEMRQAYLLPEDMERIKEVSDSQFMLLLMYNEKHWDTIEKFLTEKEKADDKNKELSDEKKKEWKETFREMLRNPDLRRKFAKLNDPLKPIRLEWDDDTPGYTNARVFFNHQTIDKDGKISPPADLEQQIVDYIDGADEDIVFNVFDYDSQKIAAACLRAAERGVNVLGGVDGKLIDPEKKDTFRPQVKAVFDMLQKHKNIKMVAVDSVGLNHQKMIMRDYKNKKKATALFSSGNFTQSCIGPEGDLCDVAAADRPKDSIPNANHITIMDSYLLAQAAVHNMKKTLLYGLRGNEYPLGGALKVFGEKPKGAKEAPYIVLSFSPKGGLGDINRDFTRRLILNTRGPLRFMQFAFSSPIVQQAILDRAALEMKESGKFDFKSIGDKPFAMRPWSVFLALVGYVLNEIEGKIKEYVEDPENPLRKILGQAAFAAFRAAVRVGPPAYGTHHYKMPDGSDREYGAKIHHKVILSGLFAVFGTSFNFSEAANHNQEQYLVTNDPLIVAAMHAGFDGLYALTTASVPEEAEHRNARYKAQQGDDDGDERQYKHVDEEARRTRAAYEKKK